MEGSVCGGGKGGVDKLLFSQGKAHGAPSCAATLMQSSERGVAFGALLEGGLHRHCTYTHTCPCTIY